MILDDDELEKEKLKNKKLRSIIILSIIILSILIVVLVGLIYYKMQHPSYITTYIDGSLVQNFDKIIDIQIDENGKTQFYIPIRAFATYLNKVNSEFGYQDYDGEYDPKTENSDMCNIIRKDQEVAVYTKGSKIIYKKNLQKNNNEYEECIADRDIFKNNGVLYASQDAIEKGYNVVITYDEKKKIIKVYTLDLLVQNQVELFAKENHGNYGVLEYESKDLNNNKSIFEDVLIVKASNKKYGMITGDHKKFILEPKYDKISYVPDSKSFLVESEGKVGLFAKDGTRKINLIYEDIISMGKNSNLYVVKSNKLFGVVDANKNDNNIIIYPQYDEIGIDVANYAYNGVKNGYIIFDEIIPLRQGKLWGLYNIKEGKIVYGFKYSQIGCNKIKSGNNIYPLLQIPDVRAIVVCDESNKYGFVDLKGNDLTPFLLNQAYIQVSNGENSYWMSYTYNGQEKELNVLDYLKQK